MSLYSNLKDWDGLSNSDILSKIINDISDPLNVILEKSDKIIKSTSLESDEINVILSSSNHIKRIIDKIVETKRSELFPAFFTIYKELKSNHNLFNEEVNLKGISKENIRWMIELETLIFKNISDKNLKISDISYDIGVSERELHRRIKKILNLTPNKYIRILKLYKAKQFIENYDYERISTVSYAVGYSDVHYFSRLFEKQYGIIPNELLKLRHKM